MNLPFWRGASASPGLARIAALALSLIIFGTTATVRAQALSGSVTGTVTAADASPIAGAHVTLSGNGAASTATTDVHGAFAFGSLRLGTYEVSAEAHGYALLSGRTVDVRGDAVRHLDLVLAKSSTTALTVIGQVRANGGGSVSSSSAPSTSVNSQAYAAQGVTRVSDMLQNDISTTLIHPLGGSTLAPTSVALRGPDPTETVIDVDGHEINNGNTGDFDLSLLDPADYGNVELVKGISPSSLVGPNTLDGAINIRTLDPTAQPHGLLRLFGGSFGTFGETLQATGTQDRLGYVVSLHRVTQGGEINQSIVDADSGDTETVGSSVDGSTALAKLRYSFGRGDGYVDFTFHDQSVVRDLSAALSSFPGPGGASSGDAVARHPFDDSSAPVLNSFAGTTAQGHNAGYGFDAQVPLGQLDASGIAQTTLQFRHLTSLGSQSVVGPGADTSPYLFNDRDLIGDDVLEIDHAMPKGSLAFQYGVRTEDLHTDFASGVVNDESVGRRPMDASSPPSDGPQIFDIDLGQTQRTAVARYTVDPTAKLHYTVATYFTNISTFGSSFDPRFGFSWTPTAQSVFRFSAGTTFQTPQLPELFTPPVLPPPVGGFITVGNPNLKPDRATEYGLGYEHDFQLGGRRSSVSADLYRVNLREPAATYLPPPVPSCQPSSSGGDSIVRKVLDSTPTCPLSFPVNAGDGVYQGLELQAEHDLAPFTTVRLGWAVRSAYLTAVPPYIQDGTLVVGEQSLGLPLHKATFSVQRDVPLGFTYGAGLVYEGQYNELNRPPFATANASLGYRFKRVELGLSATNLTNVYDDKFTQTGLGVPYSGLTGPIPTDAYALGGTAVTVTLTTRF